MDGFHIAGNQPKKRSSAAQKTILVALLPKDTILVFFTAHDFQHG
jgi:hypothetical protein